MRSMDSLSEEYDWSAEDDSWPEEVDATTNQPLTSMPAPRKRKASQLRDAVNRVLKSISDDTSDIAAYVKHTPSKYTSVSGQVASFRAEAQATQREQHRQFEVTRKTGPGTDRKTGPGTGYTA
jgi:hypothetical protein